MSVYEIEKHPSQLSMIVYNRYDISEDIFECLERYNLKKLIGKGAYGKVGQTV